MTMSHESYMNLARKEAEKSPDESNKVGCIIRRCGGYDILGVGFNSYPPSSTAPKRYGRGDEFKYARIVHAEMRALLHAQDDVTGGTLYTTLPPCPNCAKHIADAGIACVVVASDGMKSEWAKRCAADVQLGQNILDESRIAVVVLE